VDALGFFYSSVIRDELLARQSVKINVGLTIAQFPLQDFVFMDVSTG
jgi:hypothetical protein